MFCIFLICDILFHIWKHFVHFNLNLNLPSYELIRSIGIPLTLDSKVANKNIKLGYEITHDDCCFLQVLKIGSAFWTTYTKTKVIIKLKARDSVGNWPFSGCNVRVCLRLAWVEGDGSHCSRHQEHRPPHRGGHGSLEAAKPHPRILIAAVLARELSRHCTSWRHSQATLPSTTFRKSS